MDMAVFFIHCCIKAHIKITIHLLYCTFLIHCYYNTYSHFLSILTFMKFPDGHIIIIKLILLKLNL